MVCDEFIHSIDILGLPENYTERQLKKSYYKKAIQYHPDKNPDGEAEFKKINKAYEFLKKEKIDETFEEMVERYIRIYYPLLNANVIHHILKLLINKMKRKTQNLLKNMSNDSIIEIYKIISILGINNEVKERMREIIRKKIGEIIILEPTMDNLLDEAVYQLEYCGDHFYIPLWHREIVFDCSGKEIIVKCIPNVEEKIDEYNNIYITIKGDIVDILSKGYVECSISTKIFRIHAGELRIIKKQTVVLHNKGVPLANTVDIYNYNERGNIYVTLIL